jgi:hypothetical protein
MKNVIWFLKNFSWYLALLTGALGVSVVIASVNIKNIADDSNAILSTLGVKDHSISSLMTGVHWSLTISWILVGIVLAGAQTAATEPSLATLWLPHRTFGLCRFVKMLPQHESCMRVEGKRLEQVALLRPRTGAPECQVLTAVLCQPICRQPAGCAFTVVSKYFIARTRDQFRRGSMMPVGCCGWRLAPASRAVLNALHICCLIGGLWLTGLLCAQCVFFAAFTVTHRLADQASTLSGSKNEVQPHTILMYQASRA